MSLMGLLDFLRGTPPVEEERDIGPYSLQQWINSFSFDGSTYPILGSGTLGGNSEDAASTFHGFVSQAVHSDGVVFGCMLARLAVFSDVRFGFRELRNGSPGDLIGNPDGRNPASAGLGKLVRPWPGGVTGDLLARMIQDADVAGTAFIVDRGDQLARLRPDWVTIVAETPRDATMWHPDAKILGYLYKDGGFESNKDPMALSVDEVAIFAPIPDPVSRFRGMSWLQPVLGEILADKAMTRHKGKFFENGATVNLMLQYDKEMKKELFTFAKDEFGKQHQGVENAYKTLHLLGATPIPVGANMEQVDFKTVQGAGETRIAVAAGVPPIIVGLSEGLASATYSNYGQARRAFADRTIRPLWRNACGSLAQIVRAPQGTELWYDDSDVAFIREDMKDAADIRQIDAVTIKQLVDSGYKPESVVDAVSSGDWKRLKHTGLFSVQLQPPGTTSPEPMQLPNGKPKSLPVGQPS